MTKPLLICLVLLGTYILYHDLPLMAVICAVSFVFLKIQEPTLNLCQLQSWSNPVETNAKCTPFLSWKHEQGRIDGFSLPPFIQR